MLASTRLSRGSSAVVMVTSKLSNVPRTLLIARWLTVNPIVEWAGSSVQVPVRY